MVLQMVVHVCSIAQVIARTVEVVSSIALGLEITRECDIPADTSSQCRDGVPRQSHKMRQTPMAVFAKCC